MLTALNFAMWLWMVWILPMPSSKSAGQDGSAKARKEAAVTFKGKIYKSKDLSAVETRGQFLLLASDEGARVQALKRLDDVTYEASDDRTIRLPVEREDEEADLEAIACSDRFIYVIGSHARKRSKVDPEKETAAENRRRLHTVTVETSRERLYRFQIDARGKLVPGSIKWLSLRDLIANDPLLKPFQVMAGKENGVNIEGLAVDGDTRFYIGFRGPVLRGNFVPVLVVSLEKGFGEKDLSYELLFVNLEGHGIRSLAKTRDGFLILSGPMGDAKDAQRLYFWDGQDCIPGKDNPTVSQHVRRLCEMPPIAGADPAEGLALLEETDQSYRFLVVFDGIKDGGPAIFSSPR